MSSTWLIICSSKRTNYTTHVVHPFDTVNKQFRHAHFKKADSTTSLAKLEPMHMEHQLLFSLFTRDAKRLL